MTDLPKKMSFAQFADIVNLIRSHCPDQAIDDEKIIFAWYEVVAPHATYQQAEDAITRIVLSDRFADMTVHKIVPVDILKILKQDRRQRGYHIATPPPTPEIGDNPSAYIKHQAMARDLIMGGQLPNTLGLPVDGRSPERAQRRRRALAAGGTFVDRSNPDRLRAPLGPSTRREVDALRDALGRGVPYRKPTPPLATDPTIPAPRLSAVARQVAREKWPGRKLDGEERESTDTSVKWCGRCNRESHLRTWVGPDETVTQVPCWDCGPATAETGQGAA